MTRSHKANDRDHAGLADGTAEPEQHLPRYFAKSGHADADPNKTKKGGSGKGNWGREGDEVEDFAYNMTNPRRRSNSSSAARAQRDLKTKFETVDPEPVFEEELHGAPPAAAAPTTAADDDGSLEKRSTSDSSASSASVEDEDVAVKKM